MRKIYFGVEFDDFMGGNVVYTSYDNDGELTDSYHEEDIERFRDLEERGIMVELMESTFEVNNGNLSKEQIIEILSKEPGFEHCKLLEEDN